MTDAATYPVLLRGFQPAVNIVVEAMINSAEGPPKNIKTTVLTKSIIIPSIKKRLTSSKKKTIEAIFI